MFFGAMALLWAGVGRREVGIIATGIVLATFAALLLPVAFPALRSFSPRE
jgi:hypothetical protein